MSSKKRMMQVKYEFLVSKKNSASKDYYMLAELIDNSIGSWLENGKKENLEVKIIIDSGKSSIVVDDNAGGMNEKELSDSIDLNNEKEGNKLNMFGVGMKNAAFWFAQDLIIHTNCTNQKEGGLITKVETSKVLDHSKPIEWEVKKKHKIGKGTIVTLNNVYSEKMIKERNLESLTSTLSLKYMKYLDDGVKISFTFKNKDSSENQPIILDKVKIKNQVIKKEHANIFLKSFEKFYSNRPIKYLKNLKKDVIKKVENEQELVFNYKIKPSFEIDGKKPNFNFVFGILDDSYAHKGTDGGFRKFAGLTTFQNDRAINMPPKTHIKMTKDYTRRNAKRIYGLVEMGEIFRPDNNKQNFNFKGFKDEFKDMILDIGLELETIADAINATIASKGKVSVGMNKDSHRNKLQNTISSKSDLNWEIGISDALVTISKKGMKPYKLKIIEISSDEKGSEDYFINADKAGDNEDVDFVITYNINHPIWKPLSNDNENKINTKTVTYPLVALMGLSSLEVRESLISKYLGKEIDKEDIFKIMQAAAKVVVHE